ncbi:MAG: DUF3108 domain-containing protein [Prevotella sp.]|nr:DUF3108 domain-containing protein [Prevotella sp.]
MRRALFILLLTISLLIPSQADALSRAFNDREVISYQLYFNWKFVWIKAGTATMTTQPSTYKGKNVFRTSLVTQTSRKIDRFFVMRDTITSFCDLDLSPLYYRKGAREGKRYYVDEVWYTNSGNKTLATMRHLAADGEVTAEKHTYDRNVSDMINSFMRIRSMDVSSWTKGHSETVYIAGGSKLTTARLVFNGRKTVKGDDNKKYPCLVISYNEKENGKWKEIVKFYVTDDYRHIPIRLDLNLRFGTAKAFVTSIK